MGTRPSFVIFSALCNFFWLPWSPWKKVQMRTETRACDVHVQAGRSSCLRFACGSVWQQVLSGTPLEDICQKRKSEIFRLSFLGHAKFSLVLVEGMHQTEKSLQLINCCVRVIGSLATQLLSCLQGLGLNAKDLTRLSWLSSGKEQLQRELEDGFHPSVRAPGRLMAPSSPHQPPVPRVLGWEELPLLLSP